MVIKVKGVGVHPSPPPGSAYFSIMMEFTPASGRCHSVCTLWSHYFEHSFRANLLGLDQREPEKSKGQAVVAYTILKGLTHEIEIKYFDKYRPQ
jgi:hypothetical protein